MCNFKSAIEKGLEASDVADSNFQEIWSVINAANSSLSEITDSKVEIVVKYRKNTKRGPSYFATFVDNVDVSREIETRAWKNHFIEVVAMPSKYKIKKVANIETSENGFPVVISFDDIDDSCYDKESLEIRMADLLSSSSFGQAVKHAIEYSDDASYKAAFEDQAKKFLSEIMEIKDPGNDAFTPKHVQTVAAKLELDSQNIDLIIDWIESKSIGHRGSNGFITIDPSMVKDYL